MKTDLSTLRRALVINDPHAVIVTRSNRNPRKWVARTTCGQWRCTSATRRDAVLWGRASQADILRAYTASIHAYCGRTGKRLA